LQKQIPRANLQKRGVAVFLKPFRSRFARIPQIKHHQRVSAVISGEFPKQILFQALTGALANIEENQSGKKNY
jgi:hypothetical protein